MTAALSLLYFKFLRGDDKTMSWFDWLPFVFLIVALGAINLLTLAFTHAFFELTGKRLLPPAPRWTPSANL